MANELVTLQEAKLYCRVDSDEEDALILTLIHAASDAAIDIASDWTPGAEAPARLKLAVWPMSPAPMTIEIAAWIAPTPPAACCSRSGNWTSDGRASPHSRSGLDAHPPRFEKSGRGGARRDRARPGHRDHWQGSVSPLNQPTG